MTYLLVGVICFVMGYGVAHYFWMVHDSNAVQEQVIILEGHEYFLTPLNGGITKVGDVVAK